jgi:hypothetical protein
MIRALLVAIVVAGSAVVMAQQPALRVVVIEGEDAVNIIQQKTAVKPVVEVRDRNNLPVPGALVTFSIEGGKAATFGGASTMTVATNAAGQAAVSSLSPTVSGAVQINVSAAFQGQIATATITQTNVLTAAQAAAASAATGSSAGGTAGGGAGGGAGGAGGGAGGAAGGAGGGMSATTIGVVGAAVAGGAVAATQVAGKDNGGETNQPFSNFSGPFSATSQESVTSRNNGQSCTITRSISGTVTMKIANNDPNTINGDMQVTGTSTVTQSTCAVLDQTTPFGGGVPLTGSPSAIRGSSSNTNTGTGPNGEVITGTSTVTFQGSLSGNIVNGTVTFDSQSQSSGSGGGGPVDSRQSAAFPVTLTKA